MQSSSLTNVVVPSSSVFKNKMLDEEIIPTWIWGFHFFSSDRSQLVPNFIVLRIGVPFSSDFSSSWNKIIISKNRTLWYDPEKFKIFENCIKSLTRINHVKTCSKSWVLISRRFWPVNCAASLNLTDIFSNK